MRLVRHLILRRDFAVLVIYFFLALIFTYPLILHFDTHGVGHGVDDPAQTWALWWVPYSIFHLGLSPLTSDYVFYPTGLNLVAYTPTFLNGILSIPLQFLSSVVVAQNLIVLFALITSGYGAFLFAREMLMRCHAHNDFAAALAGAVYAFGAWHINYLVAGHFMLLSNEWIPFFALYLVRLDQPRWRNGVLAGFFVALTAWTELTLALFLAILAALYGVYLAFAQRRVLFSKMFARNVVALGIVAGIGTSPLALNLLLDSLRYGYYLSTGVGRPQIFSAELISFFVPSAQQPILGAAANALTNANTSYAFIGYAVLALAAIGFYFYRATHGARLWLGFVFIFAVLMLGPTLIVNAQNTNIPLPFALLRAIPVVNANRYPVRFNVMLMLALVPLVALGAARVLQMRRGGFVLAGLIVFSAFEQLVAPIPLADLRVPAAYQIIRDTPGDFAILDLPIGWRGSITMNGKLDDKAQFYQTDHHKRLLGGITSRIPQFKTQYVTTAPVIGSLIALEEGRQVDDARRARDRELAPAVLGFFDIRFVELNRALTDSAVADYAREVLPLTEIYRDETRIVYRVSEKKSAPIISARDEIAALYFDDGWGRAQSANGVDYRWATRGDSAIWLPLEPRAQTITFRLRGAHARQAVNVYVNENFVAEIQLSDTWENYSLPIPASALRASLNEFVFATDTSTINATRVDDYTIGDTGVVSPVDLAATGAGFDAGKFGEIFVAGKNVIENKRGYHLVALNPQTGAVERVALFDTLTDAHESARLAQFIAELPRGEIVAGVAVDDVSGKLQQTAVEALHSIGVESDLRFQFRAGQALIGVKGAQPGQALESVDGRLPANVSVGKNIAGDRAAFALAEIQIEKR